MAMNPAGEKVGGDPNQPANAVARVILDLLSTVPNSNEPVSLLPHARAKEIQKTAAIRAAAVSGALSLPPGPLGLLTMLPDLAAVWRIQAQMVADIGNAFGKAGRLSQEQMLYCLFRHAAAQVMRDLVARVGERLIFRHATLHVLEKTARKLGVKVTQRMLAKSVARWLPVVGSLGVAGYAFYDTTQVGATATKLFAEEMDLPPAESQAGDPKQNAS